MADQFRTVKEIFDSAEASFKPDKAGDMKAVYQYDITGEGGGKWYGKVEDRKCEVHEGEHPSPDVTIITGVQDWLDMNNGKLDSNKAMMTRKLKIKGNMSLALKLDKIFD